MQHRSLYTDGEGRGFGNRISIQTVAIFQAAQAVGRVHSVDDGKPVRSCALRVHQYLSLSSISPFIVRPD